MTFIAPLWLLLWAAAIPIALWHASRSSKVEVPALFLWPSEERTGASRRRSQFRVSASLLLQLLALAAISLALARPVFGRAPVVEHWIVLLDVSGTMGASSDGTVAFDQAWRYLVSALQKGTDGDRVLKSATVVAVSDDPYVLLAAESLPTANLAALEPPVVHSSPDWLTAADLAAWLIEEEVSYQVTLLTDAYGVASMGRRASELPDLGEAELLVFGDPVQNVGIRSAVLGGSDGEPHVDIELVLSGQVSTVPVQVIHRSSLESASEVIAEELVELSNTGLTAVKVGLPEARAGLLEIRLPSDALEADNHYYIAYPDPTKRASVAHVGDPEGAVARALRAIGRADVYTVEGLAELDTYDLAVVEEPFVEGRSLGVPTVWIGAAYDANEQVSAGPVSAVYWNDGHPLSIASDWPRLQLFGSLAASKWSNAATIVAGAEGPLIQVRSSGAGPEAYIAFDIARSNWPELPGFALFFLGFLDLVDRHVYHSEGLVCTVGDFCPLIVPDGVLGTVTIVDPDGRKVPLERRPTDLYAPLDVGFYPLVAGIHKLEGGGGGYAIAVNARIQWGPPGTGDALGSAFRVVRTAGLNDGVGTKGLLMGVGAVALTVEFLVARRTRSLRRSGLGERARGTRARIASSMHLLAIGAAILALQEAPFPDVAVPVVTTVVDPLGRPRDVASDAVSGAASSNPTWWRGRQVTVLVGRSGVGAEPSADNRVLTASNADAALKMARGLYAAGRNGVLRLPGAASGLRVNPRTLLGPYSSPWPHIALGGGGSIAEAEIIDVEVLGPVLAGVPFKVLVTVESNLEYPAVLSVYREGERQVERNVRLNAGVSLIEVPLNEEQIGLFEYSVGLRFVRPDGSAREQLWGFIVSASELPRIGLVVTDVDAAAELVSTLEEAGHQVSVLTPEESPYYATHTNPSIDAWDEFDVVALLDVAAAELSFGQQASLHEWVRDLGGGLAIFGGQRAFGPGGYFGTPLEEMSPLSARIPQERPKVAIAFVLDRSGSMSQPAGDSTRLEIAQRAIVEALGLLDEQSLAAIVAFDSEGTVVHALSDLARWTDIADTVRSIQSGGGTSILPGLDLAIEELRKAPSDVPRHVVVVTDGLSQPGDFASVLSSVLDEGITVSTVAVGRGSDTELLESLARLGGGVSHFTLDMRDVPGILAQEALLLGGEPIVTDEQHPTVVDGRMLGIDNYPLPPLSGYVRTTLKPGAWLHLQVDEDTPLLATWQYGAGRVVAFASHGWGPWTLAWVDQPAFSALWNASVRWSAAGVELHPLEVEVDRSGARVAVNVMAGPPIEGMGSADLRVTVTLLGEGGPTIELPVLKVGAGSFVGDLTLPAVAGVYRITAEHVTFPHMQAQRHVFLPNTDEPAFSDGQTSVDSVLASSLRIDSSRASEGDLLGNAVGPIVVVWQRDWVPWSVVAVLALVAAVGTSKLGEAGRLARRSVRGAVRTYQGQRSQ